MRLAVSLPPLTKIDYQGLALRCPVMESRGGLRTDGTRRAARSSATPIPIAEFADA